MARDPDDAAVGLAGRLGRLQRTVAPAATVANTLGRLRRDGLVEMRPYRSIFLTEAGAAMAAASKARHEVVVRFLRALGLDAELAEADAEALEHHLSEEALGFDGGVVESALPQSVSDHRTF